MNRLLTLVVIPAVLVSCDTVTEKTRAQADQKNITEAASVPDDTIPKVTGIGGIFFISDNPGKAKEWYGQNLGIETDPYGAVFEVRNANKPHEINYSRWSLVKKKSDYFHPSRKEFMINYRVRNLSGLVKKLRQNGVILLDSIETYEYGKFVHLLDPEGNKIELWEPVDSVLTKLGGKTNK
jgi:predicted enzyme related to lactoylglutathione lyase